MHLKYYILIVTIAVISLSGCATSTVHYKIDPSLQRDVRLFDGSEHVPLFKLCKSYGYDYNWDKFINTATMKKGTSRIVLRAGSPGVLVDGSLRRLDKPAVLSEGTLYVPASFMKSVIGSMDTETRLAKGRIPEKKISGLFTIRTIVLDPGHGGGDAGAIARQGRLMEKDVTLDLAERVRGVLEKSGIKIIMTRHDDNFVSLAKRADIANYSGADIFVSVHVNASRTRSMRGFECYYLSNAADDNARALEAFENSSLRVSSGAACERTSQLDKVLWDMAFTENRIESVELGSYICDSINRSFTLRNKGIRPAKFYVLKHTHMPSVLVEAGYISNRYEEKKLKDPLFLDKIAQTIGEGILRYKAEFEKTRGFTNT